VALQTGEGGNQGSIMLMFLVHAQFDTQSVEISEGVIGSS